MKDSDLTTKANQIAAMILSLLIVLATSKSFASNNFTFSSQSGEIRLQVSEYFKKKVRIIAPTFRFIQSKHYSLSIKDSFKTTENRVPHAVIDDFNRDGKSDLAVLGYDANTPEDLKLVIFQSHKLKGYIVRDITSLPGANTSEEIATIENGQFGLSTYLTFQKRYSKRRIASTKNIKLKKRRVKRILGVETWGATQGIYFSIKKKSIRPQ